MYKIVWSGPLKITLENVPEIVPYCVYNIVKFNDFIQLFRNNIQDYIPCKNLADNTDIARDRRLINIGAIIKKQIFIDKRQIIELFPNNSAVLAAKKTRTYYLQFNENSEKIPGVTKFDLPAPMCKAPAITVWDLQRFPNLTDYT